MKGRKTPPDVASDHLDETAHRLLEALATPAAYAWMSDGPSASALVVTGSRNGVSVRIASAPDIAGEALASAGLAVWDRSGSRPRLHITDAGRAKLRRASVGTSEEAFRVQQSLIERRRVAHEGLSVEVAVNVQESPLAWLASRKGRGGKALVEPFLLEAGERFRRDLTAGQIMPSVTANWSVVSSTGANIGMTYSDLVIAARQRVDRALVAVGPEFSGILIDVCGFLKGLEAIEADHNWPARSAKVVLGMALAKLARHYGYVSPQQSVRPASLRHWGSADYRPNIGTPVQPADQNGQV